MLLHSAACGACLTGSAARATIDHPSRLSPNAMITTPSTMPVLISRVRDRTSSASCSPVLLPSASEAIVPPCAQPRRAADSSGQRRPKTVRPPGRSAVNQVSRSIPRRGSSAPLCAGSRSPIGGGSPDYLAASSWSMAGALRLLAERRPLRPSRLRPSRLRPSRLRPSRRSEGRGSALDSAARGSRGAQDRRTGLRPSKRT